MFYLPNLIWKMLNWQSGNEITVLRAITCLATDTTDLAYVAICRAS